MSVIIKFVGTLPSKPNQHKSLDQALKDWARKNAAAVPDAHDKVGPRRRFVLLSSRRKNNRVTDENLNRVQLCFGAKKPPDNKDASRQGWRGLTAWQWITESDGPGHGLVTLDVERAQIIGAQGWLESFVLDVLTECNCRVIERMVPEQSEAS